jgi:hypothetical protein
MDKYTIFFANECNLLLNKIVETIYDKLEAFQYIPLAPAEGEGLETLSWRQFTAVGIAKIISDYANDIPSVEAYGKEVSSKVYHIATSYGYNKFELERAMRAGRNLVDTKSRAARRAIETKVDDLAWYGDSEYGIQGLVNYTGISSCTLADNEAGTSKKWVDKTPDEMAKDINDIIDTILTTTSNKEQPDTVLLPPDLMRLATTNFVDTNKTMSVLDFLKKCNPMIKTWAAVQALATAGYGGKGRILVYTNSADKLEYHLPVGLRQEDPERNGLKYSVILTADAAGTTVYYPQSVCYADGAN